MLRRFFGRFSRVDWFSFASCAVLIALTVIPIFWDISTTAGWLRSTLIAFSALTLSTIVLAQISTRESDKDFAAKIDDLKILIEASIARDSVHEVPSGNIRKVLNEMLASSNEWYFRGGSARWQRESVLPSLAKVKDRPVQYKIQIISPFDLELCNSYAAYRRKSRPDEDRADPKQIRLELLAFIYAVVVWSSRSKISPNITLLDRFSPFRLDGNSKSFVITVADPDRNELRTETGNWYHSSLLDEFEFEAGSATPLSLPNEASEAGRGKDVQTFFSALRQLNPTATEGWVDSYTNEDWEEIFELAGTTQSEPI